MKLYAIILLALVAHAAAHQEVPGEKQKKPIALTNARIYTVTNGIIERGTVVFDKAKISAVGTNVQIPPDAEVIDCKGKSVYPSFIAPNTTIGLTEIDAARPTRDMSEIGSVNANARAEVAYNPDSEIIPTVRSNGILIANAVPQGGMVAGTASLMMLDGWTREDCALKARAALVVNFPQLSTFTAPFIQKSADEQRKDNEQQVKQLYDYFERARMYSQAAKNGLADNDKDIRFEAMRTVFESNLPVMISCSEYKQIIAAIEFAKKFSLRAILVGIEDGWRCVNEIRSSNYPVIIGRVHSLPRRDDEGYDQTYQLPKVMSDAGIVFSYTDGGAWQQRNLPFQAGSSVAFGIKEEDALRGLTINPAKIFGVESRVGSIEVGKDATLFVSAGNALDALSNKVEFAFIQGKKVSLSSKQTRLAEKYRAKFKQSR